MRGSRHSTGRPEHNGSDGRADSGRDWHRELAARRQRERVQSAGAAVESRRHDRADAAAAALRVQHLEQQRVVRQTRRRRTRCVQLHQVLLEEDREQPHFAELQEHLCEALVRLRGDRHGASRVLLRRAGFIRGPLLTSGGELHLPIAQLEQQVVEDLLVLLYLLLLTHSSSVYSISMYTYTSVQNSIQ